MIKKKTTEDKTKRKSELLEELNKCRKINKRLQSVLNKKKNINELVETYRYERNLLRTLIDNLPDAIYVKDKACRKTIANPADVRNMGLQSEADVLGKNDFELFPKDLAEGFFTDDQVVMNTGQPVNNREEYVLDADGGKRWLLTSKLPLRDDKGKIIGLIGIGRDITVRKKLLESLKSERNLLRTLIDNIPDLIYFKDKDCRYVLNNSAHLRSLGVEHQNDVVGKSTYDFNPPELAGQYHKDEMQIIRTGDGIIGKEEIALNRNTEKRCWHFTSKIPLKDKDGRVTGIVGISRDITERKESEEKIYKLNRIYVILSNVNHTIIRTRNLQSLFNDICEIAVRDGKLRMAWIGLVNEESNKIELAASSGFVGDYLENLLYKLNQEELKNGPTAIVKETMEYCVSNDIESDPRLKIMWELAFKNGHHSFCALPLIVFGKLYGIFYLFSNEKYFFDEEEMGLFDEMTANVSFSIETILNEAQRKKYEEELLYAKEKAEEANRLKNSFLARMSHELRTPLNVILGSWGIIKEVHADDPDETLNKIFDSVEEESFRLLAAMTEVFDVSSIESGRFRVDLKPMSINKIVTSSYETLNPFAAKKGLLITQNCPTSEIIVLADEYCLKGVVETVLHNAIKFSDHGTINITVGSADGFGICSITDEGVGISEEYQKHLFELFSQEDVGYSRQFDGLGLGLALAKKYIGFMNGTIEIDSKKGVGTTVNFRIPLFREEY